MPYSNVASVQRRMPGFFSDPDALNYAQYIEDLDDADGEAQSIIDGFLGRIYTVPFSPFGTTPSAGPPAVLECPGLITTISNLLCRAQFLIDQYLGDGNNAVPKQSITLYDRALMLLEKLASRTIILPQADLLPSVNLGVYSNTLGIKSTIKNFNFVSQVCPNLFRQIEFQGQTVPPDQLSDPLANFSGR